MYIIHIMPSVIRSADELARIHLETAIALKGLSFVQNWVAQHGSVMAVPPPAASSGRGRKPGAASSEIRCVWSLVAGGQCKNAKVPGSGHCKIHEAKASAISAAETETGAAQLPSA
jgi:hypothetical protein